MINELVFAVPAINELGSPHTFLTQSALRIALARFQPAVDDHSHLFHAIQLALSHQVVSVCVGVRGGVPLR